MAVAEIPKHLVVKLEEKSSHNGVHVTRRLVSEQRSVTRQKLGSLVGGVMDPS
jgi:hypothetical protein